MGGQRGGGHLLPAVITVIAAELHHRVVGPGGVLQMPLRHPAALGDGAAEAGKIFHRDMACLGHQPGKAGPAVHIALLGLVQHHAPGDRVPKNTNGTDHGSLPHEYNIKYYII